MFNHLASYWWGYSETPRALLAADPILELLAEAVLFLVLFSLFIVALVLKRCRRWMLIGLIIFFPFTYLTGFLTETICGTHPHLVLQGLHDRITHDYTLDDLRHFARDMDQTGILKSGVIDHGDVSGLTSQQKEAFEQLGKKYLFMHWMDDGRYYNGPSLSEEGDVIDVFWGGALPGHWGFSISINESKNEPPPNNSRTGIDETMRLGDDIYLYYGL